ncbi:phosphopantothenate--cysteine ligase [Aricia agestis]|uniref:phosphopantothenate--cysteine ligase n=1 Tax=Aricia agestis TaxID=91739 RepID=UPI001C204B02|nr:phosphopantothenate--cysteine ligase [Aricia agestis]XP_041968057.1 phosphopantothenate--cysteine ligase [Aricia agestis]
MTSGSWEEFFATHLPPTDFEDNRSLLKEFCERHNKYGNKIALVTSGGTTVPLEHNTVRLIDNFSAGNRGATATEYFLENGYAVIFMHRQKSQEPFTRHFNGSKLLDMLDLQEQGPNTTITVKQDSVYVLAPILARYQAAHAAGALLHVSFTTVSDYFWLLRAACECLANLGPRALLFLAAAVSDFYIPKDRVPTHKMQSASGPPVIHLHLVPKMLAPLVNLWVPEAFVVSFKLETDESLLVSKGRAALEKYKHKMVVANLLQTRNQRVILITPEANQEILLTKEELHSGVEIEGPIVSEIVRLHAEHLAPR